MNVEFCEDNSGTSKKMRYFRKNRGGGGGGGGRTPGPLFSGSATAPFQPTMSNLNTFYYKVRQPYLELLHFEPELNVTFQRVTFHCNKSSELAASAGIKKSLT